MTILGFIVVIVVVGFLLWLVLTYVPMEEKIKKFLPIAVIVILILWFLQIIGVFGIVGMDTPMPRIH